MHDGSAEGPKGQWIDRFFEPVDIASLVVFRIAFGLVMVWHQLEFLLGGRLEWKFIRPILHFTYPGFDWLEPWPGWGMKLQVVGMAVAAGCLALGFFYRLSAATFFLGYLHIFLLDKAAYNNHDYLIWMIAFLMIFIPAHRSGSIDSWRRPGLERTTVPAWSLWLIRFQIGVPYFFGGLAKINYDWLVLGQPLRLWMESGRIEGSLKLAVFKEAWFGYFLSWSGLLFDLLIVPCLLWRRTRWPALLALLAFNLANSQLFTIGIFPWMMIAASMIFFPPDWPRRFGFMGQLKSPKKSGRKRRSKAKEQPVVQPKSRLVLVFVMAWVTIQVFLPFRHSLIPGHVDWTEEGHTFAWRMKIRDKTGSVQFQVVDKATGRSTIFKDFRGVLTNTQSRMLLHDPEMIRQFTHHLATQLEERGQRDFEIRVLSSISLNGREPKPMIDPGVDLAKTHREWLHAADWITPFEPDS